MQPIHATKRKAWPGRAAVAALWFLLPLSGVAVPHAAADQGLGDCLSPGQETEQLGGHLAPCAEQLVNASQWTLTIQNGLAASPFNPVVTWRLHLPHLVVPLPPLEHDGNEAVSPEGLVVTCPSDMARFQSAFRVSDGATVIYRDMVGYQDACVQQGDCLIQGDLQSGSVTFMGQKYPTSDCGWRHSSGCGGFCNIQADPWVHPCTVKPSWNVRLYGIDGVTLLTLDAEFHQSLEGTCILDR